MKKPRILFVCIGNACRSPMAEGIARALGSDVLDVESAGISPAGFVPSLTREVMSDRRIDMSSHVPKALREVDLGRFDLIVNMSGYPVPPATTVREWEVPDPIGCDKLEYERTARLIESLVSDLISEFRQS
jgi:arsenate reductase